MRCVERRCEQKMRCDDEEVRSNGRVCVRRSGETRNNCVCMKVDHGVSCGQRRK